MRKLLALTLLAALVPMLAACDSDDPMDGPNGQACDNGTLTATVDGQSFASECVTLTLSNGLLSISGTANLDGSAGPNQQQIQINGAQAATGTQTPTVATYGEIDLDNPGSVNLCAASPIPGAGGISLNVMTLDDNSASGTFSFTGLCNNDGSTVTVANGQFDISN